MPTVLAESVYLALGVLLTSVVYVLYFSNGARKLLPKFSFWMTNDQIPRSSRRKRNLIRFGLKYELWDSENIRAESFIRLLTYFQNLC